MAKMSLKMAKMRLKMAKMRPNMAKMSLKMAKMRPKMAKMRPKDGQNEAQDGQDEAQDGQEPYGKVLKRRRCLKNARYTLQKMSVGFVAETDVYLCIHFGVFSGVCARRHDSGRRRGRRNARGPAGEEGEGKPSPERSQIPVRSPGRGLTRQHPGGYDEFNRSAHSTGPGLESRCLKEEVQL